MRVSNSQFYTADELLNPKTLGVMGWCFDQQLPITTKHAIRLRGHDRDDVIQEAAKNICGRRFDRKYGAATYCRRAVEFAARRMAQQRVRQPVAQRRVEEGDWCASGGEPRPSELRELAY